MALIALMAAAVPETVAMPLTDQLLAVLAKHLRTYPGQRGSATRPMIQRTTSKRSGSYGIRSGAFFGLLFNGVF